MKFENRVAWNEGMFLRAQHFQQADRWTERLIRTSSAQLSPYPWGVAEMNIDHSALTIGQFALISLRGILPDGSPFEAPADADLPLPLKLAPLRPDDPFHDVIVYLALPIRQPGKADMMINGSDPAKMRFVATSYDAPDTSTDADFIAPIDVGRLNFRFLKTGDDLSGYAVIGLARILEIRSDGAVILDQDYIAPSLNCIADHKLKELVTELLGIVRHRAEAVAARIGDPAIRGSSEIADYFLLYILNRAEPMLAHIAANAARIHPVIFFEQCIQLAGELATFTTDSKRVNQFPPYRHDDLKASFAAVFNDLRLSLSAVWEQSSVLIELTERDHGVRVGMINDRSLLKGAGFILSVRATIAEEEIRRKLPSQIKIGPVERISELVNVALPGIPVRPLPVLPRQLPYRARTVYFELDTQNSLWQQLVTSSAIAVHLAGDFPDIEMELWALRE